MRGSTVHHCVISEFCLELPHNYVFHRKKRVSHVGTSVSHSECMGDRCTGIESVYGRQLTHCSQVLDKQIAFLINAGFSPDI